MIKAERSLNFITISEILLKIKSFYLRSYLNLGCPEETTTTTTTTTTTATTTSTTTIATTPTTTTTATTIHVSCK